MGLFMMAWLIGEGLVTYRWVKAGAPPPPGSLLAVSGFFILLGVIAESERARPVATLIAVGIDIAAFLQVLPGSNPQQATGWPPALINDPSVLLPGGASSQSLTPGGNPANTPSAVGGANAANGAPPGTPANPGTPPTGSGTMYPPGSQNL